MSATFNSVCMATYNGERFIVEQLNSILKQIQQEDEVVISDDGSTDRTVELIRNIHDPRIRLLTGNNFKDPIRNFQNGLEHCKGEYIFLSDQDDVWMDHKYSTILEKLKDYDLVISDSQIVDEQLNILHPSFFSYFKSGKGVLKNMLKSSYYGSCMAFNRKVLVSSLPFPNTKEIGHDLWLGLVAELRYSVLFYQEALVKYRRHDNAFTPEIVGKSKRNISQMIYGRIIMCKEIVKFLIKNPK